jgi:putative ABC transport system permease protein
VEIEAKVGRARVAIGLAAATGVSRAMAGVLYGVAPTDPSTFAAVTLLLITVVVLACYLPARRATRVDPLTALKHE